MHAVVTHLVKALPHSGKWRLYALLEARPVQVVPTELRRKKLRLSRARPDVANARGSLIGPRNQVLLWQDVRLVLTRLCKMGDPSGGGDAHDGASDSGHVGACGAKLMRAAAKL